MANVQVAHPLCNLRKGDRAGQCPIALLSCADPYPS